MKLTTSTGFSLSEEGPVVVSGFREGLLIGVSVSESGLSVVEIGCKKVGFVGMCPYMHTVFILQFDH